MLTTMTAPAAAPASAVRAPSPETTQVLTACLEVMDACVRLAEAGCQVLSAHAISGRPLVCVAPPPAGAGLSGALRRRTRYQEVLVSRLEGGVLVQWCIPRGRRGLRLKPHLRARARIQTQTLGGVR